MIVVMWAIADCGIWGDWNMDSRRLGLVGKRRSGGRRKPVECSGMGGKVRMGRVGGNIVNGGHNKASQDKPSRVGRREKRYLTNKTTKERRIAKSAESAECMTARSQTRDKSRSLSVPRILQVICSGPRKLLSKPAGTWAY